MRNFVEELIAEYYLTIGCIVTTNFWTPFKSVRKRSRKGFNEIYEAQSWTDIDVLAKNESELFIIQIKSSIRCKLDAIKIKEFFNRIDSYLKKGIAPDGISNIKWWLKHSKLRKIVVHEDKYSPRSYLKILSNEGIEVKYFGDYFFDIIKYIKKKKGTKENHSLMRFLHFLIKNNLIKNINDI
ncbi:MAG: hypothetical protein HYY40_00915 [Bacteroidetes bacterium]|nr:hypothetical protein [Bacteroidota bacterium]